MQPGSGDSATRGGMGANPGEVQPQFSRSEVLRRALVSIRRLPNGFRAYRSAAAVVFLDDQAHAGWLPRGDGYGGHVREMAAGVPGKAPSSAEMTRPFSAVDENGER